MISCSWQWDDVEDAGIKAAILRALSPYRTRPYGCVFVFSAGNNGREGWPYIYFPQNMPQVITVGALQPSGLRADYSAYGDAMDVLALSSASHDFCLGDVFSLDQMGALGWNPNVPYGCWADPSSDVSYTGRFGGTSASCPQVAGIAAMVLAYRPDFFQDPRYRDTVYRIVQAVIDSSAVKINGLTEWDQYYGHGVANAYRALLSVSEADYAAVLTANPECEYHAPRGQVNTETLTIGNRGSTGMAGNISKVVGAGWLTLTTGGAYTINPGDPDKVVTVTMSGVGIMTEGLYQDTIRVTHNAPNLPSPQDYPIDFFVIDDFYCPQTENLKTGVAGPGSLALDVRSDGRLASQDANGGLWRFVDSSSSIFDGSLLVAHGSQPVGDTIVYHRFYNRTDPGQSGFRAVGNLKIDTTKYGTNHGYAKACARLATKDSAVGVAMEWIFPQNADSDEFVLARYTFFSHFGPITITSATIENLVAGILGDLDITPASRYGTVQSGVENQNGGDLLKGLIWQQGTDTAGHVPSPASYTAERYRGGIEFIGPGNLIGAQVGNNVQDIQPGGGPKSEFLYRTLVTLSGISTPALPDTDMYAIMTLAKGKQLGNPHKALQVVVAFLSDTTIVNGENAFKATADKAQAYAAAIRLVSGPTNFCHGDPQCDGVSSVQDIVKMVDVGMRGFAAVFDPGFRFERTDVDCSGFTTIQDVVKVVNVAFRGGTVQANFCFPLCP